MGAERRSLWDDATALVCMFDGKKESSTRITFEASSDSWFIVE